jgi:hypothetical protein
MKAILSFVLLSGVFCWLIFSGMYNHALLLRQGALEQEVQLLLETATQAQNGYVSASMLERAMQHFEAKGMSRSKVQLTITSSNGQSAINARTPIPRGEGIHIQASYPYDGLLNINRLIGMIVPGESERFTYTASRMSEYVAP